MITAFMDAPLFSEQNQKQQQKSNTVKVVEMNYEGKHIKTQKTHTHTN